MLYKSEFAHACNDATNSPIQTAEVYQAMPDMTAIMNFVTTFGLKSRVFNCVHDSGELYVYKPERDLLYAFLTAIAAYARQPYFDIPMHIDVEESDPDADEIFREGREVNIEKFDLAEEIAKWNERFPSHQIDLAAVQKLIADCIPRHGLLDGQRKLGTGYKPRKANGDFEVLEAAAS
jgi:hypothetical protein